METFLWSTLKLFLVVRDAHTKFPTLVDMTLKLKGLLGRAGQSGGKTSKEHYMAERTAGIYWAYSTLYSRRR